MRVRRVGLVALVAMAFMLLAGCVAPDGETLADGKTAKLKLEEFKAPSGPIVLGNVAHVEFTVVNEGEADGSFAVQLLVDGQVNLEKTFRVFAGTRESSSFDFKPTEAGEYVVELAASVISEKGTTEVYAGPSTIVVQKGALLVPVRLELSHKEAALGEDVTATVKFENQGEQKGESVVPLRLDGEPILEKSISLEGGQTGTLKFTFTSQARGLRSVSVPGLDPQNVEFYLPATFEIANLRVDDDTPNQGREFSYSFTIRNVGDREGTVSYIVSLDTQNLRSEAVKISGSADTQISGKATSDQAGSVQLIVNIQEIKETLALNVQGPSLAIQMTTDPYNSEWNCYDEAFVSFTISNTGQGPADDAKVELWLDGSKSTITYGSWQGVTLAKETDDRLAEIGGGSSVSYDDLKFHVIDYCGEVDEYTLVIKVTTKQGVFSSQPLTFSV
ncbi:MAG: hypothetical protein KY455_04065 [Euryarchaeota archaeon]|nr:hypothetical protein [Euryarchaeota archaeon]